MSQTTLINLPPTRLCWRVAGNLRLRGRVRPVGRRPLGCVRLRRRPLLGGLPYRGGPNVMRRRLARRRCVLALRLSRDPLRSPAGLRACIRWGKRREMGGGPDWASPPRAAVFVFRRAGLLAFAWPRPCSRDHPGGAVWAGVFSSPPRGLSAYLPRACAGRSQNDRFLVEKQFLASR